MTRTRLEMDTSGLLITGRERASFFSGDGGLWSNVQVTISDGDIAALARAAVDRFDPDLDVRIDPADPVDPYRWDNKAWTVHAGGASSYIVASMSEEEALEKLVQDLTP
jgi:hypothetical protein